MSVIYNLGSGNKPKRTTMVITTAGPREVEVVYRRGVWAITDGVGYSYGLYVVTHLPTGAAILGNYDSAQAKRLVWAFVRAGVHKAGSRARTAKANPLDHVVSQRATRAAFGRDTDKCAAVVRAWRKREGIAK